MASPEGLWVIGAYFNPMGYRRKLSNFRSFRKHLHTPLAVVELTYGPQFELQEDDAEILVQLHEGALLWQKERLLNVALSALPSSCDKVAWLDCDIIFRNAEWAHIACSVLDRFSIVQLFEQVHHLFPGWVPGENLASHVGITQPSAVFSLVSGIPPTECIGHLRDTIRTPSDGAVGFAWAARREVLNQRGLFDACIVGGGSRAMTYAAHGCFEAIFERHYMNKSQQQRYLDWARPFYDAVRGEVGYLDLDIFHLWHGDRVNRAYRGRHEGLRSFNFDPFTDIVINQNGTWSWNTDKPEMHEYVRAYFASRREDGNDITMQKPPALGG